ncbi:MAG: hypothetical protein SGJ18_03545 [Pseudomonadota bacterium]|nr:hypothetical protein [Pseudomonadota bacterium]
MKLQIAVLIFSIFAPTLSFADSITCKVPSESQAKIVVEFDQNKLGVSLIDYYYENSEREQKSQRIFQHWPLIRGDFTLDYCNPNENEFRQYSKKYSIWSVCAPDQVVFMANFTIDSGGKLSFMRSDYSEEELEFSNCTGNKKEVVK